MQNENSSVSMRIKHVTSVLSLKNSSVLLFSRYNTRSKNSQASSTGAVFRFHNLPLVVQYPCLLHQKDQKFLLYKVLNNLILSSKIILQHCYSDIWNEANVCSSFTSISVAQAHSSQTYNCCSRLFTCTCFFYTMVQEKAQAGDWKRSANEKGSYHLWSVWPGSTAWNS